MAYVITDQRDASGHGMFSKIGRTTSEHFHAIASINDVLEGKNKVMKLSIFNSIKPADVTESKFKAQKGGSRLNEINVADI